MPKLITQMMANALCSLLTVSLEAVIYRGLALSRGIKTVYPIGEIGNWRVLAKGIAGELFASWLLSEVYYWIFIAVDELFFKKKL